MACYGATLTFTHRAWNLCLALFPHSLTSHSKTWVILTRSEHFLFLCDSSHTLTQLSAVKPAISSYRQPDQTVTSDGMDSARDVGYDMLQFHIFTTQSRLNHEKYFATRYVDNTYNNYHHYGGDTSHDILFISI